MENSGYKISETVWANCGRYIGPVTIIDFENRASKHNKGFDFCAKVRVPDTFNESKWVAPVGKSNHKAKFNREMMEDLLAFHGSKGDLEQYEGIHYIPIEDLLKI